ncbi:MAG: mannonate dehydratase [Clostridia bacterium]|nr:mannonate dehydratase [Clostridia bacterium]
MKMTFRHYGPGDPVTLEQVSQIPVIKSVVSAVYDVPAGGIWSHESIAAVKDAAAAHGLGFEVVESVPVPEEIKLGGPGANELIDHYCENVRRLGQAGVKCICYNFMPVFDWLRSEMEHPAKDGSNSLAYDEQTVLAMNPMGGSLSLPGWDESYTKEELQGLLKRYESIDEEALWRNMQTFLEAVIPVAKEAGVNMAIHPDDPPWGIFGLPRIITGRKNLERFFSLVDEQENGLTFCTGSLGANPDNDLVDMASRFADRIHFAHIRNILWTGERQFHEVAHPTDCGSLDIYGIMKALHRGGFDGYIRPDHGRRIWGEKGRYGYGLYDRALGAMYLSGLWEAIDKDSRN